MNSPESLTLTNERIESLSLKLDWIDQETQLGEAWSEDEVIDQAFHNFLLVVDALEVDKIGLIEGGQTDKCILARKLCDTFTALSAYRDDADPLEHSHLINSLLADILDDRDSELTPEACQTLQNKSVTNDIFVARSREINDAIDNGEIPTFVEKLFNARYISAPTAEKIFKSLCITSKNFASDTEPLLATLDTLTDIINEPVIKTDPDSLANALKKLEAGLNLDCFVDMYGIDRTALPEALHRMFGIKNFGDYNHSALISKYLQAQEGLAIGGDATALVLRTSTDWNSALSWKLIQEDLGALTRNGYIRMEVSSVYTIVRAILAAKRQNQGPLSSVILNAHGNRNGIQLDHNSKAELTREHILKNKQFVKRLLDRCLTPDAPIHLVACNAGHKKGVAYTLWKATGRRVTSSRARTASYLVQPSFGPLDVSYTDGFVDYPAKASDK